MPQQKRGPRAAALGYGFCPRISRHLVDKMPARALRVFFLLQGSAHASSAAKTGRNHKRRREKGASVSLIHRPTPHFPSVIHF